MKLQRVKYREIGLCWVLLSSCETQLCSEFFLIFQPCTQDEECCGEQLCVWGQCSQNATKGEAGSTCQHQTDCSLDLCCAFHKGTVQQAVQHAVLSENWSVRVLVCFLCSALLFPICLAKPIERERCFGAPNNLMELLSWDVQDEGPRKHCPCVGDLHCQHLGWVRSIPLKVVGLRWLILPKNKALRACFWQARFHVP